MPDTIQHLTLGIDEDYSGIDIRSVREILDMQPISRLPHAPSFLLGMIDVRGPSYPVVDLRTKLGLARAEPNEAAHSIILDVTAKHRAIGVGIGRTGDTFVVVFDLETPIRSDILPLANATTFSEAA